MSNTEKSPPWFLLAVLLVVFGSVVLLGKIRNGGASTLLPTPLPQVNVQGWVNTDQPPSAADLAGKWVVVDAWATWCGPCIMAMPELARLRSRWQDKDVVVIGIADDGTESLGKLKQTIDNVAGFNWPVAYGGSDAFGPLNADMIPKLVLFAPDGQRAWEGHRVSELEGFLNRTHSE